MISAQKMNAWKSLAAAICSLAVKESFTKDATDFLKSSWCETLMDFSDVHRDCINSVQMVEGDDDFVSYNSLQYQCRCTYAEITKAAEALGIPTYHPFGRATVIRSKHREKIVKYLEANKK